MLYPCGDSVAISGQRPTTTPVMVPTPGLALAQSLKTLPPWVWVAAGIGLLIVAGPEINKIIEGRRRR